MLVLLKKLIYVLLFTLLGVLASMVLHAIIEYPVIMLIIGDDGMIRGFSWETWKTVHAAGAVILLTVGLAAGAWQGFFWWPRLYDEQGRVRKKKKRD